MLKVKFRAQLIIFTLQVRRIFHIPALMVQLIFSLLDAMLQPLQHDSYPVFVVSVYRAL
jgi:hypothetical protein